MTEIQSLKELKQKYKGASLNESDTRFKIIDFILTDILKWPRDPISTEVFIDGNRADYVLKGKNDKPVLIIESKKSGKYFSLPKTANNNNSYQKVSVEKLLTDKHVKEAIYQVKEYAEDLLCQFAAICNGECWIFFRVSGSQKPWKQSPAFIIKDLDFFINHYTDALNIFGYYAVINEGTLTQHIGLEKKAYYEIFYSKNGVTAYDTVVNSNKYAGPISTIANKFLGVIPETDKEFMDFCYVSNKGKYDNLQKNIQGHLHDSLTPYFKNIGFREFTDDKQGGAFGLRLAALVRQEQLNNVMILFGGRGAGKSTFIKRFLFHIKPEEIHLYSEVALIGLLASSQTKDELVREIWHKTLSSIDKKEIRKSSRDAIIDLFEDEFEVYKIQILTGLNDSSEKYQRLVREFVIKYSNDVKLFSEKISLKFKSKNKGLIIIIDNVDQLPEDLQDVCFLTAVEISERLSCVVIVSMREERYYQAKTRGALDAYKNPGFHLSSPVIPEVIVKRIEYILEKLKYTEDIDIEYGIQNTSDLNTLNAFFNICKEQLSRQNSPLSTFLRYGTHGDVRMALSFFESFITSGYTNIHEMTARQNWYIQVHQVIKPMMIPNRFFYDESKSKIPNLYQLRNDTNSSHFTGLRILQHLHNVSGNLHSNGFIDIKYLIQIFDAKYNSKQDSIKHLALFLEKGLIEANNRLEVFSDDVDSIKITALGEYIFNYLAFNFAYIDLVCLDCALFDETLSNHLANAANQELKHYYEKDFMSRIKVRINRMDLFIDYLVKLENQEFLDLALPPDEIRFTDKLRNELDKQKEAVKRSAANKKATESDYI